MRFSIIIIIIIELVMEKDNFAKPLPSAVSVLVIVIIKNKLYWVVT